MLNERDIQQLINMLSSKDEGDACAAVTMLANSKGITDEKIAELQESKDQRLRRRIHQLQAMILLRKRREAVHDLLSGDVDFLKGMVAIHMLWYDNDNQMEVEDILRDFLIEMRRRKFTRLDDLATAMRFDADFIGHVDSNLCVDNYCVGVGLESRDLADSVLCALCRQLMLNPDDFKTVMYRGEVFLTESPMRIAPRGLSPHRNWSVVPLTDGETTDFGDTEILRFAANQLFSHAVNADSLRYVMTISQAITGRQGADAMNALPDPYRPHRT
ncbi:MAG: hypothetical protein MJ025_04525 [Victivallaceae bacterium]|nr:hypothetical protein [Victivallaceae bacterium]